MSFNCLQTAPSSSKMCRRAKRNINAPARHTHFPSLSILPGWTGSQHFAPMILPRLIHFNYLALIAFALCLKHFRFLIAALASPISCCRGWFLSAGPGLFSRLSGTGEPGTGGMGREALKPHSGSCLFVCFPGAGTGQVFTASPGKGPPILWSALC